MKKENKYIISAAVIMAVIFIFLAVFAYSLYYVMAAILTVVILIFTMAIVYVKAEHRRAVNEITHELNDILKNLKERDYSQYPADTQVFYQALSSVKQALNQREYTRKEIMDISHSVALNMEFDQTLKELIPKIANLTHSQCCAFYTVNNASKLSLRHSIGFGKNIYSEFDLTIGEGFLGHLALKKDITVVHDIPEDTIYMVRTFLGKIKPRSIMVVPVYHQEQLNGVMVCAAIDKYTEEDVAAVEMIKYCLSVAVSNGINAEKNKRLHNELAFQNKLIQNQHEVMQKRLKDKELLMYYLVNMLSDDIAFVLDANLRVLCCNKSAVAIYGYTGEEATGKSIEQIHMELGWPSIEDVLSNVAAQGELEHKFDAKSPSGNRISFEMRFTPLADENLLGIAAKIN